MQTYRSTSGSSAEGLFIELFADTFGAEKAGYLYAQYPFSDIYQNRQFADFLIENGGRKVAIEVDDEASHNPRLVSQNKFCDDLLKQNSMIYLGWDVYRWTLIDDSNRKDLFLDMVQQMDMSYSYKPVLLKAVLLFADDKGRVKLSDIVTYFREFHEARRAAGLVVEKANSIYAKGSYTDAQAQKNILSNPFKRFEDMQMLHHTKTLGVLQVDESVWKKLTREERQEIERICDGKLEQYYSRFQAAKTEDAIK